MHGKAALKIAHCSEPSMDIHSYRCISILTETKIPSDTLETLWFVKEHQVKKKKFIYLR